MFGLEGRQFISDNIIAAQKATGVLPGKLISDWCLVSLLAIYNRTE
jgi:hypothetical protein